MCAILQDDSIKCWGYSAEFRYYDGLFATKIASANDQYCFIRKEDSRIECIGGTGRPRGERLQLPDEAGSVGQLSMSSYITQRVALRGEGLGRYSLLCKPVWCWCTKKNQSWVLPVQCILVAVALALSKSTILWSAILKEIFYWSPKTLDLCWMPHWDFITLASSRQTQQSLVGVVSTIARKYKHPKI